MKFAADILLMLISYSIRTHLVEKACFYSDAAYALFPDDIRLLEMHAYALLLSEDFEAARRILEAAPETTRNIAYLRARLALISDAPQSERKQHLTTYLALVS